MPWKERSIEKMREEFVKRVLNKEKSKSELCREYGISRPTGDLWIKRYSEGESLSDKSRRPHNMPLKTDSETENLIIEYRKKYPAIGAVKIHKMLENDGYTDLPCSKTINNIFKRNGLITKEASLAATPFQRFEKSEPNEMWQADFKGHFEMKNGKRCHPLNIIDDNSRFNLCSKAQNGETFEEIKPVLISVFKEYGMPFSFLCDNGNPWGTPQSMGYTCFEVWLMELGILTLHGRPLHPQTQGKDESFNRSMTRELLKHSSFENLEDADRQFQIYRDFYNNKRPHHSLNLKVPGEIYIPSSRKYTEKIQEWEYPSDCEIRKVKSSGYFSFNNQGYFLSEAFAGKEIAIRESHISHCFNLYFRKFCIGRIDVDKRVYTFKKAYLIDGDPRLNNE